MIRASAPGANEALDVVDTYGVIGVLVLVILATTLALRNLFHRMIAGQDSIVSDLRRENERLLKRNEALQDEVVMKSGRADFYQALAERLDRELRDCKVREEYRVQHERDERDD